MKTPPVLRQGRAPTMSPTAAPTAPGGETRVLAGIRVADTPLITRALDYAKVHSEPVLFNHAVRSWLFAVRLGQLQGIAHDPEVVAVGSLLHDLGLTGRFSGGHRRFEVEGADAAREFARGQGLDDRRVFTDSVCRIVKTRPETTYDNFARDFGERFVPGYKAPSTVDFLMNGPFDE